MQSIQFFGSNFFGSEKSGFVTVTLLLIGGAAPNDITVTLELYDRSPVSAEGEKFYGLTFTGHWHLLLR